MFYTHHIFCCTNRRAEGHERGSCGQKGSEALRSYMKSRAKELGLANTRVNTAGCLDRCEFGPVVVTYPEGIWYRCATKEDVDEMLLALREGKVVERLRLTDEMKAG
ncbi:MAG TPA: (2Fe-2S) ferredoxin domain-containing protein [Alphaproteobacteria bacterium]|nr:(2Fe-2S) ferredoxin domain-containing protein [Alphaproteobacteria bacterium]